MYKVIRELSDDGTITMGVLDSEIMRFILKLEIGQYVTSKIILHIELIWSDMSSSLSF